MERSNDWYPKLVPWKNWEIPRPGKVAVIGFVIVAVVSVGLHLFVLALCRMFR